MFYRVQIEASVDAFPLRPDVPPELLPGVTVTVEIETGRILPSAIW